MVESVTPVVDADVPRSRLTMDTFLWVVVPYACLTGFVVGHLWQYRYDKFGWTTRSSQLYEDRLLRWGSPLFHFGILAVFLGHVMGLSVPKAWTEQSASPRASTTSGRSRSAPWPASVRSSAWRS
jgi:nitrate reductase gamma subunit